MTIIHVYSVMIRRTFDWSTIRLLLSFHSLIVFRVDCRSGPSDIKLFMLDDELHCESPIAL